MHRKVGLSEKAIINQTGAPYWMIRYLRDTGQLPVVVPSRGRGYSTLYAPGSVDIVRRHLNRRKSVALAVDDDDNTQPSGRRELTARPKLPPSTGSPPPLSEDREIQ